MVLHLLSIISGEWLLWEWVPTGMAGCWRWVEIDRGASEAHRQWRTGQALCCCCRGKLISAGCWSLRPVKLCHLSRNEGNLLSNERHEVSVSSNQVSAVNHQEAADSEVRLWTCVNQPVELCRATGCRVVATSRPWSYQFCSMEGKPGAI